MKVAHYLPLASLARKYGLKWSFDTNRFFNMCIILGGASYGVMWEGDFSEISHLKALIFGLILALSMLVNRIFLRNYKSNPNKCRLLAVADFALANVVVLYVLHTWTGFATIVYWFFIVGMYAGWLDDRLRDAKKRQRLYIELLLIFAVTLVTCYARFVYTSLNSPIGGGKLPVVTIYLTQKVAPLPQLQERLFLVDENDSGYYFVSNLEERGAVFIPRTYVESIQYAEQSSPK
jgi:hypothetical protein